MTEKIIEFPLLSGITLRGRLYETSHPVPKTPVLCLAGYSRNSLDFTGIASSLQAEHNVLCLDTRGRGLSDWGKPEEYNAEQEAQDLFELLPSLKWDKFHIIGTSRGGILAQILAAFMPDNVKKIVLNDIGSKLEVEGIMTIIKSLGARLDTPINNWSDAKNFMRPYAERMFPAWGESEFEAFVKGSYQEINGKLRLAFDPALASVFTDSFDPQNPPDLWPLFEMAKQKEILLIWGKLSTLLSETTVKAMQTAKPDMKLLVVEGEAHPPALRSDKQIETIMEFLG